LVVLYGQFMMHGQRNIKLLIYLSKMHGHSNIKFPPDALFCFKYNLSFLFLSFQLNLYK